MTGIGLMKLNDIDGATAAFGRFEIDFANPDYPRPDFDAVYNLARLSTGMGDVEQAQRLFQIHHRLTLRAGLPSLKVYDANLCAMVAKARQAPRQMSIDDDTIGAIAGRMNAVNRTKIVIENPETEKMKIVGLFSETEPARFAEAVSAIS
ncbi:hypothetical protein LTR94_030221, partial [Friedmanniomyces endolithicus]